MGLRSSSPFARVICAILFASSTAMANCKTLYVGSNNGQIFSYSITGSILKQVSVTNDSYPAPSWQTISGDYLYSVSETSGNDPGTITAYRISDGIFSKVSSTAGLPGPVNIAVANGGTMLISAGYGGHGINTFSTNYGFLAKTDTLTYNDTSIDPERQTASFPHQAVVDPTGVFVIIPDLGADFIRVYAIQNSRLKFLQNVQAKKGTGPRHGVFWPKKEGVKPTHYFLVAELSSTITAYKVTYSADGTNLTFDTASAKVYDTMGTSGTPASTTTTTTAAAAPSASAKPLPAAGEIDISRDGKFLYVSNRLDLTFPGPPAQDSMSSWSINSDGTLKFIGLTPAGGLSPRHFSLVTLDGQDYITVANPGSGDLAIFARNSTTGVLASTPFASVKVPGAACAVWKV